MVQGGHREDTRACGRPGSPAAQRRFFGKDALSPPSFQREPASLPLCSPSPGQMDNIIFYPGPPVQKCRRSRPAIAHDSGSERSDSLLTAAREASTIAICGGMQRAGAGERLASAPSMPMNADCVTDLYSHDGAPSLSLRLGLQTACRLMRPLRPLHLSAPVW